MPIGAKMYEQAQKDASSEEKVESSEGSTKKDDGAVEGEVVDEK